MPAFPIPQHLISVNNTTTCWTFLGNISTATLTSTGGYGRMSVDGEWKYTHRLAYEHAFGKIPKGLYIDHLCRNRACCNPDHLRPVTPSENAKNNILRRRKPSNNPRLTDDNIALIKELSHKGMSQVNIARHLSSILGHNVDPRRVWAVVHKKES